jgi:hypothetical protein
MPGKDFLMVHPLYVGQLLVGIILGLVSTELLMAEMAVAT